MPVDKKLLQLLMNHFEVGLRRVNQMISQEANRLIVSRDLAAASLGMDANLPVHRFVDETQLGTLRSARSAAYTARAPGTPASTDSGTIRGGPRANATASTRRTVVAVTGAEYRDIPSFMTGLVASAKRAAEGAYPLLHLFENSMRVLISKVLGAEYGEGWWMKVPQHLRDKASENQAREDKEKWHTPRGDKPIQYIDLLDLAAIIDHRMLWKHFEPLFPRKGWVSTLLHDVNVSRRIVAHMNDLPRAEIRSVQVAFRKWARQLKAHEDKIPG